MRAMFARASAFNQNIGNWNTSGDMMIFSASAFNQDIGSWNTEQVTDMNLCFVTLLRSTTDISSWTGSAATSAQTDMFLDATAFQAKFTCDDAVTGPARSCNTIKNTWVAPPPPPSPPPSPPSPPPLPSPPPPPEFYLVLNGVQAHWDASDLSSLNDGATLSSSDWVDKSGNERGALAPLGTVTYQATGLSDTYPCLYLSGSSTGLDTGGGTNYVRQTIVMVFRWDECNCLGTCGKAVHYLWDWRDDWGSSWTYGSHNTAGEGGSSYIWMNGNRRINAEVKNNFDTNQCSFYQGTTYHATEPIVMIWEAESPNTGNDMTLFSRYTNDENVRAQVAEIQIYDSTLSTDEKISLECGLAEKWGISYVLATKCVPPPLSPPPSLSPPPPPSPPPSPAIYINGIQIFQDSDGWILLLAYNHVGGENNELVSGKAPLSPTESYSHIWLNDLSLTADDVDSVRFYCTSSGHSRVVHFETSNIWAKSALVTGTATGNKLSYWTSGTTKFSDHTGVTPDLSNEFWNSLIEYPFYKASENHWAIRGDGSRWECDDAPYQTGARDRFTTVHQIWFKQPPLTPIPSASWHAFVEACLSEEGAEGTGECTEWASGNNYGTMPNWDTSLVEDMSGYDGEFSRLWRKSTFDGDISKWNTGK